MDALGYSGAQLSEETIQMQYADAEGGNVVDVFSKGHVFSENLEAWRAIVLHPRFKILVQLAQGLGACRVWSTDLTEGYVNFNKSE